MRTLLVWAIALPFIAHPQHSSYFCTMKTYYDGIEYVATNPAHWVEVSYVSGFEEWGELHWSPSLIETNWHYLAYGHTSEGITNCIKVWFSEDNPIYTNMLDNGAGYFVMTHETTEGEQSILGTPEFSWLFFGTNTISSTNSTGGGTPPPTP